MHVTVYSFGYLCIYLILILFTVVTYNKVSSFGTMDLQAHKLVSQDGMSPRSTQNTLTRTGQMHVALCCVP